MSCFFTEPITPRLTICRRWLFITDKSEVNWFWLRELCTLHSELHIFSTSIRYLTETSLWAIKFSVSMFLRTLTESVWQRSHQRYLRYLHIFLAVTFVATIVADLGACQPFSHYWQVVPDPGPQCRQGSAYLLTMGMLNISTNLALIFFPIPMILKSRLPIKR